jgi:hypothetical protein
MATAASRAGIIGLGFIGGADQASGDAIGQVVANLDGTHAEALSGHPRVRLVAGSSRAAGRRERITAVSGTLDLAGKPDCRGPAFHDPGGRGVLRLEGGLMGVVDATDYATAPARIEINGTLGTASSGREEVTIEPRDGRREVWPSRRRERTSMDRAVGESVDRLSTGAPFPYPAAGAARALEVLVAFHVSHARRAAWVDVPLTGADRTRAVNTA